MNDEKIFEIIFEKLRYINEKDSIFWIGGLNNAKESKTEKIS